MKKRILLALSLVIFFGGTCLGILKVRAQTADREKTIAYVKMMDQTPWTVMALATADEDNIAVDFLKNAPTGKTALEYAKYILALSAAGENPSQFGSEDYVQKLLDFYDQGQAQFGDASLLTDDIWAILALGALGKEHSFRAQGAKDFLLQNQNADGGWGYAQGAGSDTNDTVVTIMALLETGLPQDASTIQKALDYLHAAQNNDGGFGYDPSSDWGKDSDSASDAWVISVIYKLNQDPTSAVWTKSDHNPLEHMKSLQDSDGGIWWQDPAQDPTFNNKAKTPDCLIAWSGKFFPISSKHNKHELRVEDDEETICRSASHGATAMEVLINAAETCGYTYNISNEWEASMGLFLKGINGKEGWWLYVNNFSSMVSADNYYLDPADHILLNYIGQDYSTQWKVTRLAAKEEKNGYRLQGQHFNEEAEDWQDLQMEMRIKLCGDTLVTDTKGQLVLDGSKVDEECPVYIPRQIINDLGLIKSEEKVLGEWDGDDGGDDPSGQVSQKVKLKVEIEPSGDVGGDVSSISFLVNPDTINFGILQPGEEATQGVKVTNQGIAISLEANVAGDALFQENLYLEDKDWEAFYSDLLEGQTQDVDIKLAVPVDYGQEGAKEGELIFWASKK